MITEKMLNADVKSLNVAANQNWEDYRVLEVSNIKKDSADNVTRFDLTVGRQSPVYYTIAWNEDGVYAVKDQSQKSKRADEVVDDFINYVCNYR